MNKASISVGDILASGRRTLSIEVFPPKTTDSFDTVRDATEKIAALRPDYMSVTYGAGGSGSRFTLPIAANIERKYGVPVIHHLTCVGATHASVSAILDSMLAEGIVNVLALRGDVPEGADRTSWEYTYASELVADIKKRGDFSIGGACYPEGHPEAGSLDEDIKHLCDKVNAGCDFLTTQLFLENGIFYRFAEKCAAVGITVPITAGIMPVTSVKQIARIGTLSGGCIPAELRAIADRYADDPVSMRAAGTDYAIRQIRDLYSNGVSAVHLYSMNNASLASEVKDAVGDYLKAE